MLYRETDGLFSMWVGEAINDVLYPLNIEELWPEADLAALGLYAPVDPGVPEGMIATGSRVARVNGVVTVVYDLEPLPPVAPELMTYAKTPDEAVSGLRAFLGLASDDTFIDLGCGDGAIMIEAAKSGATVIGTDLDATRLATAETNLAAANVTAELRNEDILTTDLAGVTAAYGYWNDVYARMFALREGIPSGFRLAVFGVIIPWMKPEKIEQIGGSFWALYRF